MPDRLSDVIQTILAEQRRSNPNLYEMSPGQIPSHVDHRVASLLADPLVAYIRATYVERSRLQRVGYQNIEDGHIFQPQTGPIAFMEVVPVFILADEDRSDSESLEGK